MYEDKNVLDVNTGEQLEKGPVVVHSRADISTLILTNYAIFTSRRFLRT